MPADFYDQMDRAGILVDAGFQCCDAWQLPDNGKGVTAHDYRVLANSALAIGRRAAQPPEHPQLQLVRQQPDPAPGGRVDRRIPARRLPGAADRLGRVQERAGAGPVRGEGGALRLGPAALLVRHHPLRDSPTSTRTNVGGAWAFDSEAGDGATIPTLDSIGRFLSPFEQTQLWKAPDYNQYHLNYEPDLPGPSNGGYSFGTLHDLDAAMKARYGTWSSLSQFVAGGPAAELRDPAGRVRGLRRPLAPGQGAVDRDRLLAAQQGLADAAVGPLQQRLRPGRQLLRRPGGQPAAARPLRLRRRARCRWPTSPGRAWTDSRCRAGSTRWPASCSTTGPRRASPSAPGGVREDVLRPAVPAATAPPAKAQTYFVELLLRRGGQVVDRNVYWLSTQPDVVNWAKTIGQPQATMTSYANLTGLRDLAACPGLRSPRTPRPTAADDVTDVTITNTSTTPAPAFFLRADVRRGSAAGAPAAATTRCCRRCGQTTTPRCGPASQRRSRSATRPPRCTAPRRWSRCRASTSPARHVPAG